MPPTFCDFCLTLDAMVFMRTPRCRFTRAFILTTLFVGVLALPCPGLAAGGGQLELTVVEQATGKPIPCRIHLENDRGQARHVNKVPNWADHFVCPGTITLKLPKGNYRFTIDRGPEYVQRIGHFTIQDFSDDRKTVDLRRAVDMAAAGWWSGDMLVRRDVTDLELLMQAEDLHMVLVDAESKDGFTAGRPAPEDTPGVLTYEGQRFAGLWGRAITGDWGQVVLSPVNRQAFDNERPEASFEAILEKAQAENPDVWVDVAMPASWDLPLWLAHNEVDSLQLAFAGLERDSARLNKQQRSSPSEWGRGSDALGMWLQEIYYHLLNCGLRVPPSAASASGVVDNPLGYNRVYVFVGQDFSYEAWWEGLREGRAVVSNGPLLQPLVSGRRPGAVFQSNSGSLMLDISLNLATGDPIEYLEVVKNGEVVQTVRLSDWAKTGQLPPLAFETSGWFLVRAVADVHDTYRFGMTAPYYVEIGSEPRRISHRSAQFFVEWMDLLIERQRKDRKPDEPRMQMLEQAREYWAGLAEKANFE